MRKMTGLLVALALVVAACGGDDGGSYKNPEAIDSCDAIMDAGFDLLQDTLDAVGDLSPEAMTSGETPEEFVTLESQGQALTDRANELGCDPAEMDAEIAARVNDLDVAADNVLGQIILSGIRSGEGGFFNE